MRPILAIGPLTNLQDARSSAAVGFDMITFSLERGSLRMLGSNLIWNIASWLSGPSIVLELNRHSLDELSTMGDSVSIGALSFPIDDWRHWIAEGTDLTALLPVNTIWLRADEGISPAETQELQQQATSAGIDLTIVVTMTDSGAGAEALGSRIMLHFPDLSHATAFVKSSTWLPQGIFLGEEAEEEFGLLDYEAIDEWLEVVNERFEEE